MSGAASRLEPITLSRNCGAFLVELSIALHRHSIHPGGHTSLAPAAEAVARRAAKLFEDRDTLAIGVGRRQLIVEGVATDPNQPALRRLAKALHRQHLGGVSFARGIDAAEIGSALAALSRDPEREGPLGLAAPDALPTWRHLQLHPLTLERLASASAPPVQQVAGRQAAWQGAELWIELAGDAMEGVAVPSGEPGSPDGAPAEPAAVAQAIDTHPRAETFDQVIIGHLRQIAHELKDERGADTAGLRRRTARLIAELNPDTLRRLVEMGGDKVQRGRFVLDAAHGMAVDSVLQILHVAAEVSGQTVSHGLVRMLSKLAAHAEIGNEQARPIADLALRVQVVRLISDWRLIDPNPEEYARLLQRLSAAAASGIPKKGGVGADRPDPVRVTQMSIECGAVGPRLDGAVDRALEEGALGALLDLVDAPPESAGATLDTVRSRMVTPESISRIMGRQPVDFASLDRLLPAMPVESFNPLLDLLATSPDMTTRRRLLDRLSAAEADIGSLITARLYDNRWFVQRNMLVLLERSGRAPAGFSATMWAESTDARVRHQAIRFQLTLPHERDQAIRAALADGEPRLVRLGLMELQRSCPRELAPLVIALAENTEIEEDRRLLAVHALGRCRAREALDALLIMVDGGKTLLGRSKLAPRTPLVVAALRALTGAWSGDSRAAAMLAAATSSSDPEIRAAAGASRSS